MSGHIPCTCGNRKNWRVLHRNVNYSHFESPKGEAHFSEYSTVICISKDCHCCFRTKANYVATLPDYDENE